MISAKQCRSIQALSIQKHRGMLFKSRIEKIDELVNMLGGLAYKLTELSTAINTLVTEYEKLDIAKKYEYYKEKQGKTGGAAQIEDENLAYAMWEKENYDSKKAPARLEKMETSKQMWIRDSQNNIDKLVYDVDVANSYNNVNGINTSNQNVNSVWKSSNRQNTNNSIGTNMRKITPMILNNNNTNF